LEISGTTFLQESSTGLGRTMTVAGVGNTVFSGPIVNGGTAGSSSLTITNTGLTTLSGTNTYSGNTTVSGGVVLLSTTAAVTGTAARPYTVGAAGALGAGFPLDQALLGRVVTTSAGAVALGANSSNNLDFSSGGANLTAASLGAVVGGTWAYTGTLTPNGTAYRLGGGGGTLDFQSLLSGSNTLTVGGNTAGLGGTVILSNAANSFSGKTTVALGTLEFASIADVSGGNSALGAPTTTANGTIDLGSGATSATLRYVGSGSSSSNRTINLSGSTGGATIEAAGSGPLVLTGSVSAATGSKTLTLTSTSIAANAIASIGDPTSGSLSVVKEGAGVWWLTGTSSFSGGLTVKNGTVVAAANANASGNSGVFGLQSPVVGDTAPSATGTAALLVAANFSVDRDITVASGTGVGQAVLIGAASSSGTATFTGGKNLNIGRDVSLVAANGGILNFGQKWMAGSGSGTPTANVAIGADGYAGTVRLTASGTLATTGAVAVRFGTALIPSTSTTLDGAGTLTIDSGATLGGIGTVAAPLGGAGLVAPGNSPGILSAEAFDPTGGLDVAFEFTGLTPTYSGTANVNDILRLTGASPFVSGSLSAANVVSLYLPANVASGDVFTGGFFTDLSSSSFSTFLSSVTSGNFVAYYLDSSGSFAYGGNMYSLLANQVTVGTATVSGTTTFANGGSVVDGQVTTFTVVVPEPATVALAVIGVALAGYAVRRRRR
jgi:autotransporter-associated beta strand protein